MRIWAKRGIQAALVTGGMIALGTGVANAGGCDATCPPQPHVPVDGSAPAGLLSGPGVDVPIHAANNKIGTPLGEIAPPPIHNEQIKTGPLGKLVPPVKALPAGHPLSGTTIPVDGMVPIDISGNAIGILGDVETTNESEYWYHRPNAVKTNGDNGTLTGIIAGITGYVPTQITGNAIGLGGAAKTQNSALMGVHGGGDWETSGRRGTANGIIAAIRQALPVGFNNNAIAGLGTAQTHGCSTDIARIDGGLKSDGTESAAGGSVVDFSHGHPIGLNTGAYSAGGNATSHSHDTGIGEVGTPLPSRSGGEYVLTEGRRGVLSGLVAQPTLALPCELCGDAVTVAGNSDASGSKTKLSTASPGPIKTGGAESAGSGQVAQVPVSLPHGLSSTAVAGAGNATAQYDETNTMISGGPVQTTGEKSTLGGNIASAPVALLAELFSDAISAAGQANSNATSEQHVTAGGPLETKGTESVLGGNIAQVPVIAAANAVGQAYTLVGMANAKAPDSVKYVTVGGDTVAGTPDGTPENSTVASNVANVPVVASFLMADNALSGVGFAQADGNQLANFVAGGDTVTNGNRGSLSGNIVEGAVTQPLVNPAGITGTVGGNAFAEHEGVVNHVAGGDHATDGTNGSLSGNIIPVAWAGVAEVFGVAASAPGIDGTKSSVDTFSGAGGASETHGDAGSVSGNVVRAYAAPVVQVVSLAATLGGQAEAWAHDHTVAMAGGDDTTSSKKGSVAGNSIGAEVPAVVKVVGVAVAAAGNATAVAETFTAASAEYVHTTAPAGDKLSGRIMDVPVSGDLMIYNLPVELLGQAVTEVKDLSDREDEGKSLTRALPMDLSFADGLMGATDVPSFSQFNNLGSVTGMLPMAV
ncbi:hypothetical protein [Lentzea sp. NPDC004782]|uniref:hypothetical protein n=1 Tax=Lentzea sp. NPDC004782 TaxID=3154458 RepID=UPI0033A2CB8C